MNWFKDISPKVMIIAGSIIVALMLITFGKSDNIANPVQEPIIQQESNTPIDNRISLLEQEMEKKLVQNLQRMAGVGTVKVSVTLESSLRSDYAKSGSVTQKTMKESDKNGGVRESTEVTENNQLVVPNGESQPVIVMEQRPEVAGILIIAEGASDPNVRENIHNAVRTLLDIPASKISVQPMGDS